jgi:putative PIN family toxin of toxin-antitoxin system
VKLLLDTNVLVAALIARGTCSDLLEHGVRHRVVIASRPLLDELREVLSRKFRQRAADVRATVRLFEESKTGSVLPTIRKRAYRCEGTIHNDTGQH